MAGDAAFVVGNEADELSRYAPLLLPDERVAADELALRELHQPAEVRLQWRRRVVDVVSVQRHPHLETQRVARAEPRRRHAARTEQRLPDRRCIAIVEVQLEAVLAGVAGARDDRRRAGDFPFAEMVVADLRELGPGHRLEMLVS